METPAYAFALMIDVAGVIASDAGSTAHADRRTKTTLKSLGSC